MRLALAALHLLALGIGLGAVWGRSRALRGRLDTEGLRRVFVTDNWWGFAALLWLATGIVRWLMGTEKVSTYYLANPLFHAKLGLFVLILILEIWPMMSLIRWRRRRAKSGHVDTTAAGRLSAISAIEAVLVVTIVVISVAMARGYGGG